MTEEIKQETEEQTQETVETVAPVEPANEAPPEIAADGNESPALESEPAAEEPAAASEEPAPAEAAEEPAAAPVDPAQIKPVIEAIVYVAEEPVTPAQLANALQAPEDVIRKVLEELTAQYADASHGVMIREVAGGFKAATKPEHHEAVRAFVKSLKPPLKLSLAALETLATIAYKQPITGPEIMEIRGVQGAGVLKTLLDRKLIQTSGRKNVIGRPILYRTTKEFLVQFGLKDLAELPTLKEFEELRRLAIAEDETTAGQNPEDAAAQPPQPEAAQPEAGPAENPEPEPVAETTEAVPESGNPPENA